MSIVWEILGFFATVIWAVSNITAIVMMTAREMYEDYIDGQCFIGKICANIFYAPAWFFKGLRLLVLRVIR